MPDKPTYAELEHRVRELERESDRLKLAEEELRASEEKYRSILETLGMAIRDTLKTGRA